MQQHRHSLKLRLLSEPGATHEIANAVRVQNLDKRNHAHIYIYIYIYIKPYEIKIANADATFCFYN